jgi:protein-disulfide isomerase/uncharacterized membrane protein
MTKKQNLLLISTAISLGLFVYLVVHHYAVKLGVGGSALCSISETINCDAAATSRFAEVLQIPIALLGAVFQFFLLSVLVFLRLNWIDESIYLKRFVQFMLGFAAAVSIIMAVISFAIVKVLCPFCTATYVFSFIGLFIGWNLFETDDKNFSISGYFGEYKAYLILLVLIPATSWIVSGMIQENYGLSELNKIVPERIASWKRNPSYNFDPQLGLNNKVASDKIVLVEFADFKCPHCKVASKTIETFLKGRKDVQFVFKPFPLDGNCNSNDQMPKGDGTRCTLAAWAICAEQMNQKGWEMQHWLFEKQEEIAAVHDLNSLLPEIQAKFQLKTDELRACADSSATYDLLKKSSAEGNTAQVSGTPTIYLNGKKLESGHILQILSAAVNELN